MKKKQKHIKRLKNIKKRKGFYKDDSNESN